MDHLHIDPAAEVARVGPGVVWNDVNHAAAAYDLGALAGRCATVGVTGYTLGGGTGWLSRRYGYAADHLLHADLVTTDGRQVRASADEHADLFWALRGGGGNFGIVTELAFRLFPAPSIWAGLSFYPADRAAHVFAAYRDWAPTEPDEMNSAVLVMRLPAAPAIPEPLRGRQVLAVARLPPRRRAQRPAGARPPPRRRRAPAVERLRLARLPGGQRRGQRPGRAADRAAGSTSSSSTTSPMTPSPRPWLREPCRRRRSASSSCGTGAGAIARPPLDAGPSGARTVPFSVMAVAPYLAPDRQPVDALVARLAARLAPHATGEAFLNLLVDASRTADAFSPADRRRLAEVKATWDPDNVLRVNHNIPPSPVHPRSIR